MQKRTYDRKEIILIIFISAVILAVGVFLKFWQEKKPEEAASTQVATGTVIKIQTPAPKPKATPNPTGKIATFLQGPKSWKEKREWSGEWGKEYYDGGSFGGFGCGLCCMANIYTSLSEYRCSPVDMYKYAKRASMYEGGGAIDWGYMKETMTKAGFTCDVGRKPKEYASFQSMMKRSKACIVVVSSANSTCYWENTPGHYVTLFLYDEKTDKIFLADSGDPTHNRHWVSLKKIYRSLKTANHWQYMTVTDYDAKKNTWKHNSFGGNCVLPEEWRA
ncbi:MAG: hypothetical protein J1F22_00015 [Lachnospiraceae bacterium]|nr:hypothetical protein [Lachnospiraceae bacterium]